MDNKKNWSRKLKQTESSEDLGVDGRITLKNLLKKLAGWYKLDSSGSWHELVNYMIS